MLLFIIVAFNKLHACAVFYSLNKHVHIYISNCQYVQLYPTLIKMYSIITLITNIGIKFLSNYSKVWYWCFFCFFLKTDTTKQKMFQIHQYVLFSFQPWLSGWRRFILCLSLFSHQRSRHIKQTRLASPLVREWFLAVHLPLQITSI